jgi:hypothetical protein
VNDSLIKDIGRSYIVSSLLPASFFVLLAVVIFRFFLPPFTDITTQNQTIVISGGVITISFMMWVAFLLYSSVDFIFKVFEGYYFPFFIAIPLKYFQYLVQRRKLRQLRLYDSEVIRIKKLPKHKRKLEWEKLSYSINTVEAQLREREIMAPLFYDNWRSFLPTRLGNIILASELYPYEKYKLDGPMMFPRMSMIFPPEFISSFEEKNNQVVFLINSSF